MNTNFTYLFVGIDFGLREAGGRDNLRHGVISSDAETPESPVGSSWRLRRLHFPTTPATAPLPRQKPTSSLLKTLEVESFLSCGRSLLGGLGEVGCGFPAWC
jgi:hypothetical protein